MIVFIGVLVFSGIHAYMDGVDKYSNEFYENNNLQDLWMTGENFTFVNRVLSKKINKIDMVSSLKGNE